MGCGGSPCKTAVRKKVKSLSPIGEKRDLIELTNSKTLQDSYRMGGGGGLPCKTAVRKKVKSNKTLIVKPR